jgi:hypothetical protein
MQLSVDVSPIHCDTTLLAPAAYSSNLLQIDADDGDLRAQIDAVSRRARVPARALRLHALMQLPRIADELGRAESTTARSELERLATELPALHEWYRQPVTLASLRGPYVIDEATARWVCERFHYLHSHRVESIAFGLVTSEGPVALAVISTNDVPFLDVLAKANGVKNPAILSRVFAFEGAPRNAISYLLARVARTVPAMGHDGLLTYVNPNLGFTGVSYRASGWELVGEQPGTRYCYLDSHYITDRALSQRFGSRSPSEYLALLGDRFETSRLPLRPLEIFGRRCRRR